MEYKEDHIRTQAHGLHLMATQCGCDSDEYRSVLGGVMGAKVGCNEDEVRKLAQKGTKPSSCLGR